MQKTLAKTWGGDIIKIQGICTKTKKERMIPMMKKLSALPTRKRLLLLTAGLLVILLVVGIALCSYFHVRPNPARKIDATEIQSVRLSYVLESKSGVVPNWKKVLTSQEEIAEFAEQYHKVKQSHFGILPGFVTNPPEPAMGSPSPSANTARVIQKDGVEFELRVYLSMDEEERYANDVLWINSGWFFPQVETPYGGKVATRRFQCEEDSLKAFTEYVVTLAKTGDYYGG
jgi:hypothetical protein